MIRQTPWEHFLAVLSLFSDTAHIKLEQDDYLLSDDEINDIQRCVNKLGDKHNFLNTIIIKRNKLL
jgi:hypothetical protein